MIAPRYCIVKGAGFLGGNILFSYFSYVGGFFRLKCVCVLMYDIRRFVKQKPNNLILVVIELLWDVLRIVYLQVWDDFTLALHYYCDLKIQITSLSVSMFSKRRRHLIIRLTRIELKLNVNAKGEKSSKRSLKGEDVAL